MQLIYSLILILVGLAGGIAVGSGFVAFITVLKLVPRMIQIAKAYRHIHQFEYAIIGGVILFTWMDFIGWKLYAPIWFTTLFGLMMGLFIGMLAAALTEVTNVVPILVKRLRMQAHLIYLLMAMVLGKVTGSLYQWIIFQIK